MAIQLTPSGSSSYMEIAAHPDHCPICHSKVIPKLLWIEGGGRFYAADLEVVYKCPNSECDEMFIGYFRSGHSASGVLALFLTRPFEPVPIAFSQCIRDISPTFCEIYDHAHKAEEFGLTQVCGVGYRKALEFLIKDYLLRNRPDDKTAIETKLLGPCIEKYVEDPRIREVAKRAAWLGNDETHYQRRWVDKDLNDLKMLVDLVLHWIEMEHLTEEALNSMPAKT
jgi:hypothetical protein